MTKGQGLKLKNIIFSYLYFQMQGIVRELQSSELRLKGFIHKH